MSEPRTEMASVSSSSHAGISHSSDSTPPQEHHTDLSAAQSSVLDETLFPADSYTSDTKTYWADLPFWEKTKWINNQSNAEARRELGEIGRMFKRDPLSPARAYFNNYVITGLGLFVEGFTLFSVGNLKPLFKAVWPACWKTHRVCNDKWDSAIDYLEIVGIIVGQILVGVEGDWIGRRFGMVQDALIMTLGSVMLTAMWGTSLNGWVICYAWSVFVYGIGVGGEYPMTSTRAMEGSGTGRAASTGDRMHRGRKVALSFLMQGWGQLANQGILIILLLIFHGSLSAPFSETSTQWTFRVQFAVIAVFTLYLAYIRFYRMKYQDAALQAAKKRLNTSGYDVKSLKLSLSHYWHRLVGTAGGWFANDFFFYGNKIFSGIFINIITGGNSNLETIWTYNLYNIIVSLAGYYMAALLMDHKQYGRKWMQANGFVADFVLFIIGAAMFNTLTKPGSGIRAFQAIYFLSSFFNQFGPNSTSFLLAAEVFPASIRATSHGVSAAVGKLGALAPAILYNYIDNHTKFWVVSWFGLLGWILTMVFIPDTTGLDLREQERYWEYVVKGREHEYHGVAVHPRHLSLWERVVLKRHRYYDAELDRQQKMAELEVLFHSSMAEKAAGGEAPDDMLEADLQLYFQSLADGQGANKKLQPPQETGPKHPSKLAEIEKRL
ncbi:related to inorganic phosphate transporter [Melanopsichium pennsylvanicum]|uniref:Related to inorganic phosphate transporter n=2 Tax=Melanopsichium pennsylvanicum TaxID=63383 RepID=A0AAJ4XS63_9BASI|nr:related to inorganic phosphate transporter [Melanopsichium pennsylvanicum 4]SNX87348.1 related to inorganic phosphate transporter [Melanopsichium pennsylvanicum]